MLRAMEQRQKPLPVLDIHGHLLLYEEEWMARFKLYESKGKVSRSSSNGGNGKTRDARGPFVCRDNGICICPLWKMFCKRIMLS
jgi:hypothetical protein